MERKQKNNSTNKPKDTSWHEVASWYDSLLSDEGSFQSQIIAPNILRILDIKRGDKILDVACGQGFFSKLFVDAGASVTGVDLGKDLIMLAKKNVPEATFFVSSADSMKVIDGVVFDKAVIILALQNIEKVRETFVEVSRLLKPGGMVAIVINHPSFRIPKGSSWVNDGTKQYRRIDQYMSEKTIAIDMHPGQKDAVQTVSFHRPLQWYVKHAVSAGFVLTRLEEWISHKESQDGPHKAEEDRIRKEIPLFMTMVFRKEY